MFFSEEKEDEIEKNIKNNPKNKRYTILISKVFFKETFLAYNFINPKT